MKNSPKYFIAFLLSLVVTIFVIQPVNAEIIKIGDDNLDYTQGNRLILFRESQIKDFKVTTNIPKSRLTVYQKTPDSKVHPSAAQPWYNEAHYRDKHLGAYKNANYSTALEITDLSKKDKVEVNYKNVGTYDGKPIDMKLEMYDMVYKKRKQFVRDETLIDFSENPYSGYYFGNLEHGKISYTFYYSDSGKTVYLDGNTYLTVNSLNGYNVDTGLIEFTNYLNYDTSKKNSEVDAFLTPDSAIGYVRVNDVSYRDQVYAGLANDFTDYLGGKTYTRNSVSFQIKGQRQNFVFGTGYASAWNALSTGVLFPVTADEPEKSVHSSTGQSIDGKNVQVDQELVYNIKQKVHILGQDVMDKYSSFEIKDALPKDVSFSKAELVDSSNNVINNPGTIKYDSGKHTVTFQADQKFLNDTMEYIGESYTLKIYTRVKDHKANKNSKEIKFSNTASSTINKVEKSSNTVSNQIKVYKVNVKHIFEKENKVLRELNELKFDGESYKYDPVEDFAYKKNFYYVPLTDTQSGKIKSKDVSLTFYYKVPVLLEIGVKKIQIYTAEDSKGLPINVYLNNEFGKAKSMKELKGRELTLTVKDKTNNKTVINKKYDLADIEDELNEVIPSQHLEKGKHATYEAIISVSDNKDEDIIIKDSKIDTPGYASSKQQIVYKSGEKLSYKGVIMTQREIHKDVEKFHETLSMNNVKLPKQKTGYGFEVIAEITYTNDLKNAANIEIESRYGQGLIDSYLDYKKDGTETVIKLDKTKSSNSSDKTSYSQTFNLPKVLVENRTGYLFTEGQMKAKDPRIKHSLKDGGRKLYMPVWGDLKTYPITLSNTNPIGVNLVDFQAKKELEVYAYMFGSIGSETIEKDEILIEPYNYDNPFPNGLPKGWSEKDLEFFN